MVQKTSLKPVVINQINHYQNLVNEAGLKARLIVFGSQVSGKAKPWSDIDVCVVSSQFGENRHTERVRLMQLTDDLTDKIEPHPYSPSDLKNKWDPLASEIRKYGIYY